MPIGIEEAFVGRLKVHVEDVNLIIDYDLLFSKVTDSRLGRLHKNQQTQHCWLFEAVLPSIHFPLGAKVCEYVRPEILF